MKVTYHFPMDMVKFKRVIKNVRNISMKIILFSIHHIEDDRIKRHIKFLINNNYDVYYLHYNTSQKDLLSGEFSEFGEKGYRINILHKKNISKKLYLMGNKIYKDSIKAIDQLGINRGSDDVILHIHNPENLKVAKNLGKKAFKKARIIYDRHEAYENIKGIGNLKTLYLLEKIYKNGINHIIITTDAHTESTLKIFSSAMLYTVSNFPLSNEYIDKEINHKINTFNNNTEVNVIYIGSFYKAFDRDVDLMFKIAEIVLSKYDLCKFIFAGKVDDEDIKDKIEYLTDKFNGRFQYLGFIKRSEAIKLTQQAHIGLVLLKPTFWIQSSSNKIYEYLICGNVPIIKANIDHADIINQCSLLFKKESTEEYIIEEVEKLFSDRNQIKEMMENAKRISTNFTWENAAKKYIEAYNKLE
jgi:glycosyltransferase involved in cell wall biosynthesis